MVIVAGLTGGIATGKTTVSRIFQNAGAMVIDADVIARQVTQKGTPGYEEIIRHFGAQVIGTNGELDRKLLGAIIFSDNRKKEILNGIVHPHVIQRTNAELAAIRKKSPRSVVILDVPLLFEAGMDEGLDEVIVVYIPETVQLIRLMRRDRLSRHDAMARINAQLSIEKKRERATILIDNTCSVAETRTRVLTVYSRLREKAVDA